MKNLVSAPAILIRDAYLAYHHTVLFNHLNLTLAAEKITCLLGPSGVGKSTLLRMIAQLVTNDKHTQFSGNITCDNSLSLQSQISYMAQTDSLMPWLTAFENTLISARLNNKVSVEKKEKAIQLFHQTNLSSAIHKYPKELSGGMRQRVALIRTLLQEKPIVLMDEPFSALDAITRFQLQTLSAELLKNRTVLFITHDPVEALRLANEIYILSGQPATLNSPLLLTTSPPRDPSNAEFITHQAKLFHALLQAKKGII